MCIDIHVESGKNIYCVILYQNVFSNLLYMVVSVSSSSHNCDNK